MFSAEDVTVTLLPVKMQPVLLANFIAVGFFDDVAGVEEAVEGFGVVVQCFFADAAHGAGANAKHVCDVFVADGVVV